MTKFIKGIVAAAAMLAVTGAAGAEERRQLTVDGTRYVYTTSTDAQGNTVFDGRTTKDNSQFRLVVRDGKVRGNVGGRTVRYAVADARGAAKGAEATVMAD